jgi:cytidine deaminase
MNRELKSKMLSAARRAAGRAHAPYSKSRVGAAVLDDRGHIHAGCNVENGSYGLTICAERAAIARAVCAGMKSLRAVLVFTDTEDLTPPCGACLQVIAEFGDNPAIVLANDRRTRSLRLNDFLPRRFRLKER